MARVAVFHNTLDFQGGADAVCLHTCAALSENYDVTLFTASKTDPSTLAERFDVPIEVAVVQPPGATVLATAFESLGPVVGPQLAARTTLLRALTKRRLDSYDAVVSTANELSLPVPSVQYVHFPQFRLDRVTAADAGVLNPVWSRLAGPSLADLATERTRLLANSAWTADVTERCYDVRPVVCHPPVDPVEGRPWTEREHGLLVLGRIAPDKRTLDAVEVLDRLHERGIDLTGHVLGAAPAAYREYVDRVERAAAERSYLTVETDVPRARLTDLLGRYRYGLNMKKKEHFGMAVAEYVAAGMLPFAPGDGGQVDVLDGDDRLLFDDLYGAVDRIERAVETGLRPFLPRDRFGSDRFAAEMREHVAAILR
jgi:glycosyltransferase involved in cell wall biosynthesis